MIKEILDNKAEKHVSSGKYSISSVGGCWHKKYSELKKLYKEEFNEKTFRIFAQGDFFHQRLVSELTSKGPSSGYHVAAAECDIRNNKYISGRCDMILSHAPSKNLYIVDFKSCSKWAFDNVKKGEVSQTYKDQVLLYMHIFHIPRGYLLFINKASSEIEEYEVPYNKERAEFLINQIKYFFENFVEKDVAPPKCDGGQWGCGCCWPSQSQNKPSSAQLDTILKQQLKVPKLFERFIPTISKELLQESEPKTHVVTTSFQEPYNQTLDKKWVKV